MRLLRTSLGSDTLWPPREAKGCGVKTYVSLGGSRLNREKEAGRLVVGPILVETVKHVAVGLARHRRLEVGPVAAQMQVKGREGLGLQA